MNKNRQKNGQFKTVLIRLFQLRLNRKPTACKEDNVVDDACVVDNVD